MAMTQFFVIPAVFTAPLLLSPELSGRIPIQKTTGPSPSRMPVSTSLCPAVLDRLPPLPSHPKSQTSAP
uniref:Uncharacterized protein n=1 Tax=Aegilops tauschii subsp. strangulata TaxID=200361 RepID=A0A453SG56_AEGTS